MMMLSELFIICYLRIRLETFGALNREPALQTGGFGLMRRGHTGGRPSLTDEVIELHYGKRRTRCF